MAKVIQRIYELVDKVSPGLSKMQHGTVRYKRELTNLKKVGTAAFKGLAIGVAGATAAVTGLAAAGTVLANKFSSATGQIDAASKRAGVGTTYFQEMQYAMNRVGVEAGVVERLLKRTNQRMGMADAGNKKYTEALQRMGVATRDVNGNLRSAEAVFDDAIDSLSKLTNAQERATLAGDFFGVMAAQNLLPALEAGGDEIRKLREEAHRFGVVIDEDGIKAGNLWADSMDKLRQATRGMWNTLAQSYLPHFNRGIQWLVDRIPAAQKTLRDMLGSVSQAFRDNAERFAVIKNIVDEVRSGISNALGMSGEGGGAVSWFTNVAIPGVVGGLASVVEGMKTVYDYVKENWQNIVLITYGIVASIVAYKLAVKGLAVVKFGATAAMVGYAAAVKGLTVAKKALTIAMKAFYVLLHPITTAKKVGTAAMAAYGVVVKGLTIAKGAATGALVAFRMALNALPIGWAIASINLLIGAGVLLITNWDKVKSAADKTWNGVVKGMEWMVNKVIDGFNAMVKGAIWPLDQMIKGINAALGTDFSPLNFKLEHVNWAGGNEGRGLSGLSAGAAMGAATAIRGSGINTGARASTNANQIFEERMASYNVQYENDELITALNSNTDMLSSTRGGGNTFNITVNATDLTAEEIADKLVPRIERHLCGN